MSWGRYYKVMGKENEGVTSKFLTVYWNKALNSVQIFFLERLSTRSQSAWVNTSLGTLLVQTALVSLGSPAEC